MAENETNNQMDDSSALRELQAAVDIGRLSMSAAENVRVWLTEPAYAEFADAVRQHISREQWSELNDAFWTVIPFRTAGRRGMMYPIGPGAINDRTVGESAQGLAEYVLGRRHPGSPLACAGTAGQPGHV